MALTPNDVLNKQFQTTKFRDGYDQDEVDDFLDEVLAEFQRLIAENDQLTTRLASAPASAPVDSGEVTALRSQLEAAEAKAGRLAAELAESQRALQTAQQAAADATMLDGMNSAEYLQLARRVHEEHVRDGVVKRDELIAEGESKAAQLLADAEAQSDQLVGQAQSRATQLTTDAESTAQTLTAESQAKAEALLSEAQTRRDREIGALTGEVETLTATRDALQTGVEELKEFERKYRTSLRSYLETQLGELTASGVDVPPSAAPSAPPAAPVVETEPQERTGGHSGWDAVSLEETLTGTGSFEPASAAVEPDFGTIEVTPAATYEAPGLEATGDQGSWTPPVPGLGGN